MKRILLLLADGFEIFEASAYIDVMGWNLIDGDGSTELFTCGAEKEVKTSFNQRFIVDYTIDTIDAALFDALAIPGGFEEYGFYESAYSDAFLNIIRQFKLNNKIISSICVGALPLGKSGILKGKKATTYNMNPIRGEALRNFGVELVDEPIVKGNNITTSWNPSTAIDVALLLLEDLTTKENADYIRQIMGFEKK